jgi:peptide/nickel transport system permease protein
MSQIEYDFEFPQKEMSFQKKMVKYLKFLIIPFYKPYELSEWESKVAQFKSQRKFFRKLLNPITLLGFGIIIFIVTFAVFSSWLTPFSYRELAEYTFEGSFSAPSPEHILGQTLLGRDVLGRIIWGAQTSLTLGSVAILISVTGGVIIGIISAYIGGIPDSIIMRIFDILLAFPTLIIVFIFIAIFGQNINIILIAFGILGIPAYARLIRGSVLQVKEGVFIEAARVSGANNFKIMFKYILPNVISPIIIAISFDYGGIILGLAGLSFLGLGDPNTIEWGVDINAGRLRLYSAPWASLWPGLMIFITVLGFMLVGDGLRDALDPRLKLTKKRRVKR